MNNPMYSLQDFVRRAARMVTGKSVKRLKA